MLLSPAKNSILCTSVKLVGVLAINCLLGHFEAQCLLGVLDPARFLDTSRLDGRTMIECRSAMSPG